MSKKVIKPGVWWTVRVRLYADWRYVSRVLACSNKTKAGRRGSERKVERKYPYASWGARDELKFVARRWKLERPHFDSRFSYAYKFDDLKDAQKSSKCAAIKKFGETHDLIVEIVEHSGCLHYGTRVSEQVIERQFRGEEFNEMEVLAIEFALGVGAPTPTAI